jgi:DNA-directed RNA polymerase subunit beta'
MSNPTAPKKTDSFDAVMLSIASPEDVISWSHGEVTKPETVNYRTQRAEPDGLFCERIFGPTKNFQCFCGKYKGIRYSGVVCEKCSVEVTRSIVRRERMAHINLAVPVAHIWFLRSSPSRIGLLLDLPIKTLEQIVYFAAYIVITADEEQKGKMREDLDSDFEQRRKQIKKDHDDTMKQLKEDGASKEQMEALDAETAEKLDKLKENHKNATDDLDLISVGSVLSELKFREVNMKFGHIFRAGTGAESLREIIMNLDLEELSKQLEEDRTQASGQKLKKIMKRMKLVSALKVSNIKPEWMIMSRLPVIPPDLRPMVQLDGGRFAASDLNDLYRRVINRNNRLKKLMSIGAPEVICRNEKRMLQESVDTLLNNSARAGKTLFTAGDRRKLRSLSDMLKGKQGRFRQNLLGKRVDYSGRSVIVVGPELNIDECGLPKEMAMKLFKPFVIGKLIQQELAHNVKAAERLIIDGRKEVWDILQNVIRGKHVLLNRAPTLHRLGIQAFRPVLVEGLAIRLHPLVCAAFNADFDGDQMAVHVPLSTSAQSEAARLMSPRSNLLKPSAGDPIITPTQDMVLGCYFLTTKNDKLNKGGIEPPAFSSISEALLAMEESIIHLHQPIRVRLDEDNLELTETTAGRLIFNEKSPDELGFINEATTKGILSDLIARSLELAGATRTVEFADAIKKLGFEYATISGISIGAEDIVIPESKTKILEEANEQVEKINSQYWKGWITADERYRHAIRTWAQVKNNITSDMIKYYENEDENDIAYMIQSGARGNWGQLAQLAAMKGLVANPSGKTIELPVQSNLKEGFSVLEYFIATHGGRKGKSDTALKTAEAGYLTRRLVDAVQDILITEEDCKSNHENMITRAESEQIGEKFEKRLFGRTLARDLVSPTTGEVLAVRNDEIDADLIEKINENKIDEISLRSVITCVAERGLCSKCYGRDLGNNKPVKIGTPIGIIAAQSIGEPGTQLTMRTFHMGGVAEGSDITQGLTRVEELFEARAPKTPATLSDISGVVKSSQKQGKVTMKIIGAEDGETVENLPPAFKPFVKTGEKVKERQVIAKSTQDKSSVRSPISGIIKEASEQRVVIQHTEAQERIYEFSSNETILVKNNQKVEAGEPLNAGHFNLQELMEKKGVLAVQKYIVSEVQHIYASQGQTINDKHLEIIARKIFSKHRVLDSGDTSLLVGDTVDHSVLRKENEEAVSAGKKPAVVEQLLLGLSRVSLATDSWLAAASFQETIRVLVEASTTNKIDPLAGLKENVIIGRLIPAGEIYRETFVEGEEAEEEKEAGEIVLEVEEDAEENTEAESVDTKEAEEETKATEGNSDETEDSEPSKEAGEDENSPEDPEKDVVQDESIE